MLTFGILWHSLVRPTWSFLVRRTFNFNDILVLCTIVVGGPNKAHTLETNAYKIQFHKD